MIPLEYRILQLIYGDGEAFHTYELVESLGVAEDMVLDACQRLESKGYLFDQGIDLWVEDEDDSKFKSVWQLTKDGIMTAEAMR